MISGPHWQASTYPCQTSSIAPNPSCFPPIAGKARAMPFSTRARIMAAPLLSVTPPFAAFSAPPTGQLAARALSRPPSAHTVRELAASAACADLDADGAKQAAIELARWGLHPERGEVTRWDAAHVTGELGLDKVGVKTDKRGFIEVAFYPNSAFLKLAKLENDKINSDKRKIDDVRKAVFEVVQSGGSYDYVLKTIEYY